MWSVSRFSGIVRRVEMTGYMFKTKWFYRASPAIPDIRDQTQRLSVHDFLVDVGLIDQSPAVNDIT